MHTVSDTLCILQEVAMHPHSKLTQMEEAFEKPSILHISSKDGLRAYTKPPVFDKNYLVIFDSVRILESNFGQIKWRFMFPVLVCKSKSMVTDAKALCQEKGVSYKVFVNPFEKPDAMDLIRSVASVQVSDSFCKALISRVGLNPTRLISGSMVCEQVGYSTSNISKYIDKYTYIDVYDVIDVLLGVVKSAAQRKRASMYLHLNRIWYKRYTKDVLVSEVDTLIKIFLDSLSGALTIYNLNDYLEDNHVSRFKVLHATELLEKKSINELYALRQFLNSASLLEVAMRL